MSGNPSMVAHPQGVRPTAAQTPTAPQQGAAGVRMPNGQQLTPAQVAQLQAQRVAAQRAAAMRAQGQAPQGQRPAQPQPQAKAQAQAQAQAAPQIAEANRCHIMSRTPIFDAHRVVQMYRLRFSSGNKFITDRLLPQHVASVVNDYFVQRSVVNFVGSKSKALVMMPVSPELIPLVKKGVASRLVLQIPSYQEPSVQVVDFMAKIKRFGIRFAVDLMDLLKHSWLKGILHIEYIMINMSSQGAWQLAVFQKLKVKAPWLKIIAYGANEPTLLKMVQSYRADLVISNMSTSTMTFKQSPALLEPFQADIMALVHELFRPNINYPIFKKYLAENRAILKIVIYFVHRFKNVDLKVLGNMSDIYNYLISHEPIPSFSTILIHGLLSHYTKCVQSASLHVIDELYRRVLIHGYFTEYMIMRAQNASNEDRHYCFQTGMFYLLPEILLKSKDDLAEDRYLFAITKRINADKSLICRTIVCLDDMENNNLQGVFDYAREFKVPSSRIWAAYENAIIRANEVMIAMQVVTNSR